LIELALKSVLLTLQFLDELILLLVFAPQPIALSLLNFKLSFDSGNMSDKVDDLSSLGLKASCGSSEISGGLVELLLHFSLRSSLILKLGKKFLDGLVIFLIMALTFRELLVSLLKLSCMTGLGVGEPLRQVSGLGFLNAKIIDELLDLLPELAVLSVGSIKLLTSSMEVGIESVKSLVIISRYILTRE
jgi:hypothetical protein